jgi:hypothetical protein
MGRTPQQACVRAAIQLALLLAVVSTATCADPSGPSCTTCPAPPPVGAVLVGAGDIGQCGSPGTEATAQMLDDLFPDSTTPGTIFTAGDNAYPHGQAKDFTDCYQPTWGRHLDRTRPAPGNHEYEFDNARAYYNFFGSNAGPAFQGYYAFSMGSWRVISLNSESPTGIGSNSPQAQWLRQELAANPRTCTAAIWHRPLFTSGPNPDTQDIFDLFKILYDANVEFVINGHDHMYERFAPQDPNGKADPVRGVREFVVGTGGAGLYSPVSVKPNSERIESAWGLLKLSLDSDSYSWVFLPVLGTGTFDSGTTACH